jgi:rhamnosyltransferase
MHKIASVIVSFNGTENVEKTVFALMDQVDSVIIVDNGSGPETIRVLRGLDRESKIRIIYNAKNMGIAHALNRGISHAKEDGFDWVLTMDQDSVADGDMVQRLFEGVEQFAGDGKTVSFSPRINYDSGQPSGGGGGDGRPKKTYEEKLVVITSGNLLSVRAFETVGGFREDLYIDSVDFDFCLRLKKAGCRIMRCNRALLRHSLGERKEYRFLGRKRSFPSHGPRRNYYIVRNHIYVLKNYLLDFPAFCVRKQINMNGIILRAVFLESDRRDNVKYMWRGFRDGIRNKYGGLEPAA